MLIHEIFPSLQGEGPDACSPAVFIRLRGCNLNCKWCDTKYALTSGTDFKSVDQVLEEVVVKSKSTYAIITGGEPLVQADELDQLVQRLIEMQYKVAIETNGTLPPPDWWKDVVWDIDHKCPSSGVKVPFDYSWIGVGDVGRIKFVVADEVDLAYVSKTLSRFQGPAKPEVIISPMIPTITTLDMMNRRWLQRVWDFCIVNHVRFSLQVHKVVWGAKRGV